VTEHTSHLTPSDADQVPASPDELVFTEPGEEQERPRWYWPLFAAMLAALAVAMVVWPIVVYQALVP
jgi:hypothetical protein